jgi:hypothetical protein
LGRSPNDSWIETFQRTFQVFLQGCSEQNDSSRFSLSLL